MTFAIITPALMIGAFAERMKFSAVLVFCSAWLLTVYVPICHMTWAGAGGLFADWGVMDFAGGIVVHVTAGFAALVACIMIGPRAGYPKHLGPASQHDDDLDRYGDALGRLVRASTREVHCRADGQCRDGVVRDASVSFGCDDRVDVASSGSELGKPSVLGAATGSIAGLAAITPASGYVGPLGDIGDRCIVGSALLYLCHRHQAQIRL